MKDSGFESVASAESVEPYEGDLGGDFVNNYGDEVGAENGVGDTDMSRRAFGGFMAGAVAAVTAIAGSSKAEAQRAAPKGMDRRAIFEAENRRFDAHLARICERSGPQFVSEAVRMQRLFDANPTDPQALSWSVDLATRPGAMIDNVPLNSIYRKFEFKITKHPTTPLTYKLSVHAIFKDSGHDIHSNEGQGKTITLTPRQR